MPPTATAGQAHLHSVDLWWSTPVGELAVYHLAMLAAMLAGATVFYRQLRSIDIERGEILGALPLTVALPVLCARLVDVIFYAPELLFGPVWRLLDVFSGGLSSHGAVFGLVLLATILARRYRRSVFTIGDRLLLWGLIGLAATRTADHLHGQGIGTPADLPWATLFHDSVPRHPTHLYEIVLVVALAVAAVLALHRWGTSRPGVVSTSAMAVYFLGRLFLDGWREVATVSESSPFTVGQALSVPFFVFFFAAALSRLRARPVISKPYPEAAQSSSSNGPARRRRIGAASLISLALCAVLGGVFQQLVTDPGLRGGIDRWRAIDLLRFGVVWAVPLFGLSRLGAKLGNLWAPGDGKRPRSAVWCLLLLFALAAAMVFLIRLSPPAAALAWLVLSLVLFFRHGPRDLAVFLLTGVVATLIGWLLAPALPELFPKRMVGPAVPLYFGLAGVTGNAAWERLSRPR